MIRGERSLIGTTALAHGLVHAIEFTYAVLLTRIGAEFGVGAAALGFVANASAFAFGASSLPAGYLTDRLGSRNVLYLCFLTAAGAAVLVGLSPNVAVLGVALGVLGFTIGLYHPPAIALLAQSTRQRGIALGYHGVVGNLGSALWPLAATALAVAFSWPVAYFFLAAMAVAMVVLLRTVLPRTTVTYREVRLAHRSGRGGAPAHNSPLAALLTVFAALVLIGFVYRAAITFLFVHLGDNLKLDLWGKSGDDLAGFLATPLLFMGGIGQYVGGSLAQKFTMERIALGLAIWLAPALLFTGLGSGVVLLVSAAGYIFFSFATQPVLDLLIADYTPQRFLGRSYGLAFFASFGVGSVGGTFAGLFAERWGTETIYLALTGFGALIALLSFALSLGSARPRGAPLAAMAQGSGGAVQQRR